MNYIPQYDQYGNLTGIQCGNMSIPLDPGNQDYQRFLTWLAANNLTQAQWLSQNPWTPWGPTGPTGGTGSQGPTGPTGPYDTLAVPDATVGSVKKGL